MTDKKVTECPKCGKAGSWQWTADLPKDEIRHIACGEVFKMSDWIYKFKTRHYRRSDSTPVIVEVKV